MFLSGGTAQFEVYGLRTRTAFDYTIVVDDYWGNTTQEATGTFVTLRRRGHGGVHRAARARRQRPPHRRRADDGVGESPSLGWFAEGGDKDAFSGLCSEGVGIGSTGESACYSWITVTDQVDTSSLLDSHSYPFRYQGSNSDSLQLKVSGTVTVEYV